MNVQFNGAMSLGVFLGLASMACTSDKDDANGGGSCNNSSFDGYQTFTVNGETRNYILQLPSAYDAASSENLPLIINFHGNGGCAGDFSAGTYDGPSDLSAVADRNNVIVAYPQGVVRVKGAEEWDPGDNGSTSIIDNDVYFTQQLISDISSNHAIDANRIYATGYSNGGMMAYGLACELGSEIAAVGIMSGIMLGSSCEQSYHTPVIHFHGTEDDALPYEGNNDFQSVADVISIWVNQNEIPSDGLVTTILDDGLVTQDSYTGGAEDSSVVLYTTLGGGHVWFGEDIDGQNPNDILWTFLSGYGLNGSL